MVDGTGNGSESADGQTDGPDPVEERVADWSRRVGRFLAAAAARAREGAEDIVAEAQSIRRGERD